MRTRIALYSISAVFAVLAVASAVFFHQPSSLAAGASVSVQLADERGQVGSEGTSNGAWSGFVSDRNGFDPDMMRVKLEGLPPNTDIRVSLQMSDDPACSGQIGPARETPWASQMVSSGSGDTGWVTDSNAFDPDCARVKVETRTPPSGTRINRVRLGINASDYACREQVGNVRFTPWSDVGGGWSDFVSDGNGFDPDCYALTLQADVERAGEVTVTVRSPDGTIPAPWTLLDVNDRAAGSGKGNGTVGNVPFGTYSLTAPNTFEYNKITYTLESITPASQNLGAASCKEGTVRPYLTTQNGVCQQVDACGVSTCTKFEGGGGGPGPGPIDKALQTLLLKAKSFFAPAASAIGIVDRYGVCIDGGCVSKEGDEPGTCTSNKQCGGSDTPPPAPPPAPQPPDPTSIGFIVTYTRPSVPDPAKVACSPSADPVEVGQEVTFSATGGGQTPAYTWSAPGASPQSSGTGNTFKGSYATTGKKEVVITDTKSQLPGGAPNTSVCYVTVVPVGGTCDKPTKIDVVSNVATTWQLSSAAGTLSSPASPVFTYTHNSVNPGTWVITPEEIPGYIGPSVTPGSAQTLSCGGSVKFTLNYTEDNNPTGPVACRPNYQEIEAGQTAKLKGSGENGTYAWTASYGTPSSGTTSGDQDFAVSYTKLGTRTVKVTSAGKSDWCDVYVKPACPGAATLVIDPATTTVKVGETAVYRALYDSDGPDCSASGDKNVTNSANWVSEDPTVGQIVDKGDALGKKVGSTMVHATYSGLTADAGLGVTSDTLPDFACSLIPNSITLAQGETKTGQVQCTPKNSFTGGIALTKRNLPSASSLSFNPSTVSIPPATTTSAYSFTAGATTATGSYTAYVKGTSGSIIHEYPLNIIVTGPAAPKLTVSLSADPASGKEPLSTDLTPLVGGTATGNIDYWLWFDCDYRGTSLGGAENRCGTAAGNKGATLLGQTDISPTFPATYRSIGSSTPLVLVKRRNATNGEELWAYDSTLVEVTKDGCPGCGSDDLNVSLIATPSLGDVPLTSRLNANVGGNATGNIDYWFWRSCAYRGINLASAKAQCGNPQSTFENEVSNFKSTNAEYSTQGVYTPFVIVKRGGFFAADFDRVTATDPACTGTDCVCDPADPTCDITDGTGACSTFTASPKFVRKGSSVTLSWTCEGTVPSCEVVNGSGKRVASDPDGGSGSGSDKPQTTAEGRYTLSCDNGRIQRSASVNVVESIDEVPPR